MTWILLTTKNIFDMSNTALFNIQQHISMESWLQSSAHTWVWWWCQLDSWTAGERGRGCWETKAAAATTPAGRHLGDNITKHTSLWGTSNRCAFYFIDNVSIFLHQRQADAIKLIKLTDLGSAGEQVCETGRDPAETFPACHQICLWMLLSPRLLSASSLGSLWTGCWRRTSP